ncbi:uncharacterized protein [Hemitrygon akajei]|uniref:uncharacterized protein n=1 Tax=Hemitrygon akajei TaxID=2704970 RepID=UPI003BF961A6
MTKTGRVLLGQKEIGLPYVYEAAPFLTVRLASSMFLEILSASRVHIQYDFKGGRVYVIMHQYTIGETLGLCGTFTRNHLENLMSANYLIDSVPRVFVNSWKASPQCIDLPPMPVYDPCKANPQKESYAKEKCSIIKSRIFNSCHFISPDQFYDQCLQYVCSCSDPQKCMCLALANYAHFCLLYGVYIDFRAAVLECAVNCTNDMVYTVDKYTCERNCYHLSTGKTCHFLPSSGPVEGCRCPEDTYYNPHTQTCSDTIMDCPCYLNELVYKPGEKTLSPSPMKYQDCVCKAAEINCSQVLVYQKEQCTKNEVYVNCMGNEVGKKCEPSCESLSNKQNLCSLTCEEGCMCKPNFVRSPEGRCINKNMCPCKHDGMLYFPGEVFLDNCNVCTCLGGLVNCREADCSKTCVAHGESQYVLFDKLWLEYQSNDCKVLLTESMPNTTDVPFKVEVQNAACASFGSGICRKNVYVTVGAVTLTLDSTDGIIPYPEDPSSPFRISHLGFFVIVETVIGLTVLWDLQMQVLVQIKPELMKYVHGFCGEGDESVSAHLHNIKTLGSDYGKQWVMSMCKPLLVDIPKAEDVGYAETQCNQLLGKLFSSCHQEIHVDQYYKSCKSVTAKCYKGKGDMCYCGSIAAYSQTCCREGITIDWRKPDNCPSDCENYNREPGTGPLSIFNKNGQAISVEAASRGLSLEKQSSSKELWTSFMVTPALYKASLNGLSLESVNYPNYFVRYYDNGTVSLEKWQMANEFLKQASFVIHKNKWFDNHDAFESYISPNHYLTADPNGHLSMRGYTVGNEDNMSFTYTESDSVMKNYVPCKWRYRPCENPCTKTCQDPLGAKCTLILKIEGCFPYCPEDMLLDEITHRCVHLADCNSPATSLGMEPEAESESLATGSSSHSFEPKLTENHANSSSATATNKNETASETVVSHIIVNKELSTNDMTPLMLGAHSTAEPFDTVKISTSRTPEDRDTRKSTIHPIGSSHTNETAPGTMGILLNETTHNTSRIEDKRNTTTLENYPSTASPATEGMQLKIAVHEITATYNNATNLATRESHATARYPETREPQAHAANPERTDNHANVIGPETGIIHTHTASSETTGVNYRATPAITGNDTVSVFHETRSINKATPGTLSNNVDTSAFESIRNHDNIIIWDTRRFHSDKSVQDTRNALSGYKTAPLTMSKDSDVPEIPHSSADPITSESRERVIIKITPRNLRNIREITAKAPKDKKMETHAAAAKTSVTLINTSAPETRFTHTDATHNHTNAFPEINVKFPEASVTFTNMTYIEARSSWENETTPQPRDTHTTAALKANLLRPAPTIIHTNVSKASDAHNSPETSIVLTGRTSEISGTYTTTAGIVHITANTPGSRITHNSAPPENSDIQPDKAVPDGSVIDINTTNHETNTSYTTARVPEARGSHYNGTSAEIVDTPTSPESAVTLNNATSPGFSAPRTGIDVAAPESNVTHVNAASPKASTNPDNFSAKPRAAYVSVSTVVHTNATAQAIHVSHPGATSREIHTSASLNGTRHREKKSALVEPHIHSNITTWEAGILYVNTTAGEASGMLSDAATETSITHTDAVSPEIAGLYNKATIAQTAASKAAPIKNNATPTRETFTSTSAPETATPVNETSITSTSPPEHRLTHVNRNCPETDNPQTNRTAFDSNVDRTDTPVLKTSNTYINATANEIHVSSTNENSPTTTSSYGTEISINHASATVQEVSFTDTSASPAQVTGSQAGVTSPESWHPHTSAAGPEDSIVCASGEISVININATSPENTATYTNATTPDSRVMHSDAMGPETAFIQTSATTPEPREVHTHTTSLGTKHSCISVSDRGIRDINVHLSMGNYTESAPPGTSAAEQRKMAAHRTVSGVWSSSTNTTAPETMNYELNTTDQMTLDMIINAQVRESFSIEPNTTTPEIRDAAPSVNFREVLSAHRNIRNHMIMDNIITFMGLKTRKTKSNARALELGLTRSTKTPEAAAVKSIAGTSEIKGSRTNTTALERIGHSKNPTAPETTGNDLLTAVPVVTSYSTPGTGISTNTTPETVVTETNSTVPRTRGISTSTTTPQTLSCDETKCAHPRTCDKYGEAPIYSVNVSDPCCNITTCGPVCSFNNTSIMPGQTRQRLDGQVCTTFTCTNELNSDGFLTLNVSTQMCETSCDEGFELRKSQDKNVCCPECVQVNCAYISPNSSEIILIKLHQTYIVDNCTRVLCVEIDGHLVTEVESVICPELDEAVHRVSGGEVVADSSNCCQHCTYQQMIAQCSKTVKNVKLMAGSCSTEADIAVCEGRCSSITCYDPSSERTATHSSCCLPDGAKSTEVTLTCTNGKTRRYSITEPGSCRCRTSC